MQLFRSALIGFAIFLLFVALADRSIQALMAALLLAAAAYCIHRRLVEIWWLGLVFFIWLSVDALVAFFRAPATPLARMCAIIDVLFYIVLTMIWSRQRSYFDVKDPSEAKAK